MCITVLLEVKFGVEAAFQFVCLLLLILDYILH